jgi:hypothetical protein
MLLPFPHRKNSDGSIDSICSRCAATVANTRDESTLQAAEQSHACTPLRMEVPPQQVLGPSHSDRLPPTSARSLPEDRNPLSSKLA